MRPNYSDVLDVARKASRSPVWWDWYGVPRFCIPEDCYSHRQEAYAMRRIRCFECGRLFRVSLVGAEGRLYGRSGPELRHLAGVGIGGELEPEATILLGLGPEVASVVARAMREKGWEAATHGDVELEAYTDPLLGPEMLRPKIPSDWTYGLPPYHGHGVLGPEDRCATGSQAPSVPEHAWRNVWPRMPEGFGDPYPRAAWRVG